MTLGKESLKRGTGVKQFIKVFLIALVIFTGIGIPFHWTFRSAAEAPVFGESESNLLNEMSPLYDASSPFFEAFEDKQRVNILLLGVNTGLTDTIILASFDMKAKHVDLISVPRDTYYKRPGYNLPAQMKINAAYQKEPVNTARAVSDILLGMPIHYYAVVTYEGVSNIVDAMGGVPMDIPFTMKYNDRYDKPPLKIYIKEGPQVLDGEHAVQFLRFRHANRGSGYKSYPEGDIGRVKAQQEFMKSAFKQMMSFKLPQITKEIFKNVDSDITLDMSLKIAKEALGMSPENIETYMIPNKPDPEPPYYVYPQSEEIADMLTQIYSIEAQEESDKTTDEKNDETKMVLDSGGL